MTYHTEADRVLVKDTPTLPKIGRLIHVRGYDKCRAAIVTGEGFITIFAPNLKPQEAVLRENSVSWSKGITSVSIQEGWHYVDECTS